jgi:NAD+ kinase
MLAERIAILAAPTPAAEIARERLLALYKTCPPEEADVIVAIGGDGFMLSTQFQLLDTGKAVFGMNQGTVGFLMNRYDEANLLERIEAASQERIHPLQMLATDASGNCHRSMAFNEVSLFRQSAQAARLHIEIDGIVRMEALVCDGVMVATPQGSTAYNLSAHGPILPLRAPLLALTPVSPFRPRGWKGALIPNLSRVKITALEPEKRPVNAVADNTEIKNAVTVEIYEDRDATGHLLFDPEHTWEERILEEQFRI